MLEKPKDEQPNNPLHGVKLADILEFLVDRFGWEKLGKRIKIKCFNNDPSIKSSLKFLRRTDWARKEVEELYLNSQLRKETPAKTPNPVKKGKAIKFGGR